MRSFERRVAAARLAAVVALAQVDLGVVEDQVGVAVLQRPTDAADLRRLKYDAMVPIIF